MVIGSSRRSWTIFAVIESPFVVVFSCRMSWDGCRVSCQPLNLIRSPACNDMQGQADCEYRIHPRNDRRQSRW